MVTVFLLRRGETRRNKLDESWGRTQVPLGTDGIQQIRPSDDADDEGGISDWVSLDKQVTDTLSHTLVRTLILVSLHSHDC